jgi:hypothetical protein
LESWKILALLALRFCIAAMRLRELVNVEELSAGLKNADSGLLDIWKQTAIDIASKPGSKDYLEIDRLCKIYQEIPESELVPEKFVTYAEGILVILNDEDRQKEFIRAEMLPYRIFE